MLLAFSKKMDYEVEVKDLRLLIASPIFLLASAIILLSSFQQGICSSLIESILTSKADDSCR